MALTKITTNIIADDAITADKIAAGAIDSTHITGISTSDVAEGTNLYYTDARVGSYLTTNSYATESYVTTAVSNLVDAAPAALDTLNELAAALGDDANFSTTVTNSIATKWTQDNTKISNWDTAYGWGDHASAGYLTGNQTITLTGDVSGSGTTSIVVTVADDSHTHDGRYYTESEADSRFVNASGDTVSGNLTITGNLDVDGSGVVNAVRGYKVGGTQIINSSGSVVGAPTITLANDAADTASHRITVFDSGATSYGMMLWNDNGSSGDWGTMIYGPNQDNRTISFGKIIDSTFTNHADVRQIAYFDLDNGNFVHKGQVGYDTTIRAYPQNSSDDAILQLLGQGNDPTSEGFEIWYDNDVGDVSLSTTYSDAAADIHFRTATGASKSTSNTRLTLHGGGNATFYANANSIASIQTISATGYNYINIAGADNFDSGIIFSEGDGITAANRRMMIGYDAAYDYLRFYTYYRSDGTTAVNSNRATLDTYGNFNIGGAYSIDGSIVIDENRRIISERSANASHISKFINTNTGTSAYSEIWVQNSGTSDALVLGYSKNYSSPEWSGKGWVYSRSGPLALKTYSTLQIYSGGLDDNYISATYDSSGNYAHLRGNASFDNQVKIKAASHPSASGTALTVGDTASEGLRFGSYGHLLSSDTHICHNIYYTGSAWAQISASIPSSTINLGSGSAADILFGYTAAGSTSISYPYTFNRSGTAVFDNHLAIGGSAIGTRTGLSVTSAGGSESQAVFQSENHGAAFGILSLDNATYLSQNIYYDGGVWVHDSYSSQQRNTLLAFKAQDGSHGIYWYASDNGSGSWNVASNVQLFNGYGYCTADITTNNFRSTAPHFLTSETLELGNYGSSWGHPYISMASSWAGGAYPTIGSTGGSAGSLIMLHNPHVPFRTDNAASGQTGRGGIRCALDSNASSYYDIGTYSQSGVTEGFQIARGGVRYMYTVGGDDFIFADNVSVDNGNLLIGDQAFSSSTDYVGMKTSYQSGSNDYMILSGTSDGNTYVSAKDGVAVYIRGGGNNSSNQIQIPDGTTITATTSNFICSGNVTAYSDERLKSDVQTLDGAKVLAMRGVSFTKDGKAGSGVIAQELEQVAPELVHTAEDDMETKSVAYGNLVGYLIEAVKMQQAQIDELKALLKEKNNGND